MNKILERSLAPNQNPRLEMKRPIKRKIKKPQYRTAQPIDTVAPSIRDLMGIPPSARQITAMGINIVHVAGGKMVERWGGWEDLSLMQQLGVVTLPTPAKEKTER